MKQSAGLSPLRCVGIAVFMLCMLAFLSFISSSEAVPTGKSLSQFPKKIDQWVGKEGFFDQKIYDVLGVDDSALIDYRSSDGKFIGLYVGYYDSQKEGDLIHSPKNCMPGSGWQIKRTTLEELSVPGVPSKKIKIIKLFIEKGAASQVVLYWFQSRGRFIASEYMQKVYLVWDAIFKSRTDGSFVRLMAPVGPQGEAYTTEYMKGFAERLIPLLAQFLPGENA